MEIDPLTNQYVSATEPSHSCNHSLRDLYNMIYDRVGIPRLEDCVDLDLPDTV